MKAFILRILCLFLFLAASWQWAKADEYMVDEYEILDDLSALNEEDTYVVLGYNTKDLMGGTPATTAGYLKNETVPTIDYDNKTIKVVRNSENYGSPQEFKLVKSEEENVFMLKLADGDNCLFSETDKELLVKPRPSTATSSYQWKIGRGNNNPLLYMMNMKTSKYVVKYTTTGFTATSIPQGSSSYYFGALCRKKQRIITIGATGYAAYVTTHATDFSKTAGLAAYQVTATSSTAANLHQVALVPAETGVILKAIAGDYIVKEVFAEIEPLSDNLLKHGQRITGAGTPKYALASKSNGVGFYRVADNVSIPYNKPYLEISKTESKDFLGFDFGNLEDIATTVQNISTSFQLNSPVLNLQGQLVAHPTQGIYIKNGKKIVIR